MPIRGVLWHQGETDVVRGTALHLEVVSIAPGNGNRIEVTYDKPLGSGNNTSLYRGFDRGDRVVADDGSDAASCAEGLPVQ